MVKYLRLLAAFAIAPMTAPLLAIIAGRLSGGLVFYEFILSLGSLVGYGCAAIFGIPAYLLYFRKPQPMRFLPFLWFTVACTAVYFVVMGSIVVAQDGLSALLQRTIWGYGVVFFVSTGLSVAVFYLIAFFKIRASEPF